MNWFPNKAFGLVVLGWLAASAAAQGQVPMSAAPAAQGPPPEIKLNGLTTILGDKRALFKVRNDSGPVESYFLAEGQSAGAIKLLSVDIRAGKIKVNNHGVVQTVSLCDPPDLSILMASEIGGDKSGGGLFHQKNTGGSFGGAMLAGSTMAGGMAAGQNSGAGYPAGTAAGGKAAAGTANNLPGAAPSDNKSGHDQMPVLQAPMLPPPVQAPIHKDLNLIR